MNAKLVETYPRESHKHWLAMQRFAQGVLLSMVIHRDISSMKAFFDYVEKELAKREDQRLIERMDTLNIRGLIDEIEVIEHVIGHDSRQFQTRSQVLKTRLAMWNLPSFLIMHFFSVTETSATYLKNRSDSYSNYLASRGQIVEGNTRLVWSIAAKYKYLGLSYDDITQEGMLGLIKAVDYFDFSKGFQFSTYAFRVINQYIHDALDKQANTVRKPFNVLREKSRVALAQARLEQQKGRAVSNQEIAKDLELDPYIVDVLSTRYMSRSADDERQTQLKPSQDELVSSLTYDRSYEGAYGESSANDGPERNAVMTDSQALQGVLLTLSKRDANMVRMRFGIGLKKEYTLAEISEMTGLSGERVRQIVNQSIKRMKVFLSEPEKSLSS